MRGCRDGGERELTATATFTTVLDPVDLAWAQQRERDSGSRCIVLRETRRGEWRGMAAREAREGGVSGFILPHGRGLGWSNVGRDWASRAVVWDGTMGWF
jgi:hypothetical protein